MARRGQQQQEEAQLYEATTSFASQWVEDNALSDFPTGVVRVGTLVRAGHPILEAHGQWFEPAQAHVGEGTRPSRRQVVG